MKICMINGVLHQGSSYNIGKLVIDKIKDEKEVEEFYLPNDLPHNCIGCLNCLSDIKTCPFWKSKEPIYKAMVEADLIILTSPTYCMHMSSGMKAFFELFFDEWMSHRPLKEMFLKKAVVVSSCAGAGHAGVTKELKQGLFYMGVPYVKRLGFSVQAGNWLDVAPKKKDKINKKVEKLVRHLHLERKPHVGFKTKFMFNIFKNMQTHHMGSHPCELAYWREQGWLNHSRPWNKK